MITGTHSIGKVFVELDTVDSTNKYAAELNALSKVQHGTVILAHEQTAGRGQRGRNWLSGAGKDLAMSVVLHPGKLRAENQFVLSKVIAVAVLDLVRSELKWNAGLGGGEVKIKWPNDILVERRKVAGILIKNDIIGPLVVGTVVGIGLNVNSTELEAELNATSLRLETGREVDRMALLDRLCQRIEHYWDLWTEGGADVGSLYSKALYWRGRWADLVLDDAPFQARPMDVDDLGRLIVEDASRTVQAYGHDRLRFAPR